MADFNEVIRREPNSARSTASAATSGREGRPGQGARRPEPGGQAVPDDYEALSAGATSGREGRSGRAIADYDEALKLDPAFAEARFHRALAHVARNEPDQALADYRQLIRLDPQTPEGYKDWGRPRTRRAAARPSIGWKRPCKRPRPRPGPFAAGHRPAQGQANSTRPSPSTTRRWNCIPAIPRSITTAAWPTARRTTCAKADRQLHAGHPAGSEIRRRLCQPRLRLLQAGPSRPGASRFRQDSSTRSEQRRRPEEQGSDREDAERGQQKVGDAGKREQMTKLE